MKKLSKIQSKYLLDDDDDDDINLAEKMRKKNHKAKTRRRFMFLPRSISILRTK